ncbi:hypothetical protein HY227_02565 [Candidatus Wolfebacteria bacterium]|nr:hypothetical protein [Candidatus Wolfebacteria bacterium]
MAPRAILFSLKIFKDRESTQGTERTNYPRAANCCPFWRAGVAEWRG